MRGFSDDERERIRERLVQTGRELLVTYGPEKTTVKDVTDPVGIAKPTFYQFFDSKSDLYRIILHRELDAFEGSLRSEVDDAEDPREGLVRFFRSYADFGESNEFIQEMFIKRDYRDTLSGFSADQIADVERKEMEILIPHIRRIQERGTGPISEMDPMTVLGLMGSSLGLLVLHRDEYDEYAAELEDVDDEFYEHIRETLITVLARGLTIEEPGADRR